MEEIAGIKPLQGLASKLTKENKSSVLALGQKQFV